MKVLYIGHYRDGSGWASAAQEYILALDSVGVDVVPRPIKLNNHQGPLPAKLLELETKSTRGCEVCIQNVLPHLMVGTHMRDIGLPFLESTINNTPWIQHLKLMDDVWVACSNNRNSLYEAGIKYAKTVPVPADFSRYKTTEPANIPCKGYTFYTIGDLTRRKNFAALVKAFHLAFHPSEPVNLIIKTHKAGVSPQEVAEEMKHMCQTVKTQLKLYPSLDNYKSELIIANHISPEKLMGLHEECDCYVSTAYGEGWGLPAFDALAMGNQVVYPSISAIGDFAPSNYMYKASRQPCFALPDTFPFLYTGRDTYAETELYELIWIMQKAYSQRDDLFHVDLKEYSRMALGKQMKELL